MDKTQGREEVNCRSISEFRKVVLCEVSVQEVVYEEFVELWTLKLDYGQIISQV